MGRARRRIGKRRRRIRRKMKRRKRRRRKRRRQHEKIVIDSRQKCNVVGASADFSCGKRDVYGCDFFVDLLYLIIL